MSGTNQNGGVAMDEETTKYLEQIGLTPPLMRRVDEILKAFTFLCVEPLRRVFVSDRMNETTGDREYDGVWGFSDTFWMWGEEFVLKNAVDVAPYGVAISYVSIAYKNLDLPDQVRPESRLSVEVQSNGRLYQQITATGDNCGFLLAIVDKFLVPNLIGQTV